METTTKSGAHKLNYKDVAEIRKMFDMGLSDTEIAEIKGVSRPHINLIRNGKRWNADNWSQIPKNYEEGNFNPPSGGDISKPTEVSLNQEYSSINEYMNTDDFQTKYHLIKFIECLTGKKPNKLVIEF